MEPFWDAENTGSRADRLNEVQLRFETHSKNRLDEEIKHIVLLVLVSLTDTVPKHNGPEQIYFKNVYFSPEDLSFHIIMWPW